MTSAACCLTAQKRAACGAQRAGCPSEPAPSALHPTTTLLQCLCAHRSAVHPHSQRHMAAAPAPKMCKSSGNTALALPFPRRGSQHSNRAKWRPRTEPWAVPFFRSRRSDPWSRHQHGSCGRSSCVFGAVAHQARRAVRPPTVHSLCVFPNDWLGILSIAQFRTMHVPNDTKFKYTKVVAPARRYTPALLVVCVADRQCR